jgi:hypothetical protein
LVGLTLGAPVVASAAPPSATIPCGNVTALAAAITAANAGGGTINLAAGCDYVLTSADANGNGLPVVVASIGVNGNGASIDGNGIARVLEVAGGNLTLNDLIITGGSAPDFGGGIANVGGTLTLNHTQVTGNAAAIAGGGIASATFDPSSVAKLTLNNSTVTENKQTADPFTEGGLGGGGIVNLLGTATLNSSQVSHNFALGFVGNGIANGDYMGFSGTSSLLTLNNSQVNGNTGPNSGGGGIQNLLGKVTVNSSQVNGNTSLNGGGISSGNGNGSAPPCNGSVILNQSQVNGNTATAPTPAGPGAGPPIAAGGIANGCSMVLNSTQVDGNVAAHTSGAGIVNHGVMTLNKSEVNNNTAAGRGALASGGGIISAVACDPHTGICAPNTGVLSLNNSQVNGNTAGGNGGGISNGLALPQMTLQGGPLTLNHSQVTGNTAGIGGGGIFNTGGTVTLSGTAVTGNHPDNCESQPGNIAGCVG